MQKRLEYVTNQTPEICILAVHQNGMALKYVENPTSEICRVAIKQNKYSVEFTPDFIIQELL